MVTSAPFYRLLSSHQLRWDGFMQLSLSVVTETGTWDIMGLQFASFSVIMVGDPHGWNPAFYVETIPVELSYHPKSSEAQGQYCGTSNKPGVELPMVWRGSVLSARMAPLWPKYKIFFQRHVDLGHICMGSKAGTCIAAQSRDGKSDYKVTTIAMQAGGILAFVE